MAPLLAQTTGVDRAFERLYRRHALDVYRYAYAVLRNPADAEDVAQTTFMNAYRALERGDTPASPQNWLIAIAHNVCRQRFRQQSRRVQEVGLDVDVADTLVRREEDDAPTPEDIKRALGHLAFNQRAALVLREIEGRSYAEIADLLDVTVSAVETLIFRARRALREQLQGSLTCGQAELALSRQLDAELGRDERSQLRAHLRECAACRRLARSQRAQRSAFKALGAVPLPSSLTSLFGGGGATIAAKAAAVVVAAGVAGGVTYDVHRGLAPPAPRHHVQVVKHTAAVVPAVRGPRQSVASVPIAAVAVAKTAALRAVRIRPRPAAPPVTQAPDPVQQPVQPAAAPDEPPAGANVTEPDAVAPVVTAHARRDGRQVEHGQAKRETGRSRGNGNKDSGKNGATPPAASNPGPPDQPASAGGADQGDTSGQSDKGNPNDSPPEVPLPVLPLPLPPVGDLTQTSQKDVARNDGVGHLHP